MRALMVFSRRASGRCKLPRHSSPIRRPASSDSATRSSGVPRVPMSPAVKSSAPVRYPCSPIRISVPPQVCSMSSGCAAIASTSSVIARRSPAPAAPASRETECLPPVDRNHRHLSLYRSRSSASPSMSLSSYVEFRLPPRLLHHLLRVFAQAASRARVKCHPFHLPVQVPPPPVPLARSHHLHQHHPRHESAHVREKRHAPPCDASVTAPTPLNTCITNQ